MFCPKLSNLRAACCFLCLFFLVGGTCLAQKPAMNSPLDLLDHLAGQWVLQGTIAGKQTTHDVQAEWVLKRDPRIVFCAAVDRNGYLPTHNKIYSQPQGDDPVWNAANCRNRRIFNDRTGLAAGRNRRKFLLQTYRRDMGNGNYVLMKDASVPIKIDGRHWGGLRIGFKA